MKDPTIDLDVARTGYGVEALQSVLRVAAALTDARNYTGVNGQDVVAFTDRSGAAYGDLVWTGASYVFAPRAEEPEGYE